MIFVTDRQFNVLADIHLNKTAGLLASHDVFQQDIETGVDTYKLDVFKSDDFVSFVEPGCFLMAKGYDNIIRVFEIMRTEEDDEIKEVYCESAGLDLINEVVPAYAADKAYPISHYFEKFTIDSGWELSTDITGERKLSWDSYETAAKRVKQLARSFDAELYYSVEMTDDGKIHKRIVNIKKRLGIDEGVYLTLGVDIDKLRRVVDASDLATAIMPVGTDEQGNKITIDGFSYDDGRFFVRSDKILDRETGLIWSRHHSTDDGYIVAYYESQAKTKERLFQEGLSQLKKRNTLKVQFEVSSSQLPSTIQLGDTVRIYANEYKPKIQVSARVVKVERSLFFEDEGTYTISNVVERQETLDDKVVALSKILANTKQDIYKRIDTIELVPGPQGEPGRDGVKGDKGDKGEPGQRGADGKRMYTWIVFSDDAQGNGLSLEPTNKKFIGFGSGETETPVLTASLYRFVTLTDRTLLNAIEILQNEGRSLSSRLDGLIVTVEQKPTYEQLNALNTKFSNVEKDYQDMLNRTQVEKLPELRETLTRQLGNTALQIETINKFLSISDDGVRLRDKTGSLELKMDNGEIAMFDGGKKVMYINNQMLYITSGIFVTSLQIGNHVIEKVRESNIHTVIRYVGGGR
ncbi:phage tail protein [Carnobacteriaceae bacterium zg-ZUI78]|nr:phage tail protein [Carnobacteriaceae bacterium zg-ZUI78]